MPRLVGDHVTSWLESEALTTCAPEGILCDSLAGQSTKEDYTKDTHCCLSIALD